MYNENQLYACKDIATLWEARKGDVNYIHRGNKLILQSKEYLDEQGEDKTSMAYKHESEIVDVLEQFKVSTDLYYTRVQAYNGTIFDVFDDQIQLVLIPTTEKINA